MAFLIRWLIAFVLIAATWNPTPINYVRWARANWDSQLPLAVLGGVILGIGYLIYLRATVRSIGIAGMLIVVALFAALVWVLIDFGILETGNSVTNQWLAIILASIVLGVGLTWSIVRRKISGQVDMDDLEES